MKAVILFGSPRKDGNTIQVTNAFTDVLKDCGHSITIFYLNDMDIRPCQGCLVCLAEGMCALHDDMTTVRAHIMESDLIVYATPIYWFGPSGQLKITMDRSLAFEDENFNSRIKGKKAVTLMTCGDEDRDTCTQTREMFRKTFDLLGLIDAGTVEATGCQVKGEVRDEFVARAKGLARSFE